MIFLSDGGREDHPGLPLKFRHVFRSSRGKAIRAIGRSAMVIGAAFSVLESDVAPHPESFSWTAPIQASSGWEDKA
jgi:hypothetical protein